MYTLSTRSRIREHRAGTIARNSFESSHASVAVREVATRDRTEPRTATEQVNKNEAASLDSKSKRVRSAVVAGSFFGAWNQYTRRFASLYSRAYSEAGELLSRERDVFPADA